MNYLGAICALNVLAIIACLFVLYAEYEYMSIMSRAMMICLATINVLSFVVNMGWVR